MTSNTPALQKVDAVLVRVPSIEQGLAFYHEHLGMLIRWIKHDMAAVGLGDAELVMSTRLGPETDFLVGSIEHVVQLFDDARGRVIVPPEDIPVGKMAVVEDPFGNALTLIELSKGLYQTDASGNVTGVSR